MANAYSAVGPGSSLDQAMAVINNNFARIDREVVTKTFKNSAGKNGLIIGSLPNNQGIGIILNDNDGNPAIIINVGTDNTPQIETLSPDGVITKKTSQGTDYYYDASGINYMQIGKLPDGTYGMVVAKAGFNVSDAFS